MFEVNKVIDVVLVFLLQLWKYFTHFPNVSLTDFGQVNVTWEISVFMTKVEHIIAN